MTLRSYLVMTVAVLSAAPASGALIKCSMTFSVSGWSAMYKTASGTGTITCDNGQSAPVTIKTTGGGLTFGKTKIVDGHGEFSPVGSMDEIFGSYAIAEASAGAGKAATGQVMTKGTVSLALSGKGQGVTLGFDFGKFTIERSAGKAD
jgi:hypothetical protein